MERITRHSISLIVVAAIVWPADAFGQQPSATQPRDEPSSTIVIDSPPPAPASPSAAPSTGVVLQRPGQVLLMGKPVHVQFRSPTDGVSFQLRVGGSYSSISGVSMGWGGMGWGGMGWGGPGWGWGGYGYGGYGYGFGGYGISPYYGEIVTKTYQPICEAPCDATLLSGRHRLALSLQGGTPINIAEPIDLTTDSVIEGRYVDKSRLRKAGWATFIAGSVAGMAMMFASVNYHYDGYYGTQLRYEPMFYTGVGVFVSAVIAGAVLAAQNDEAHVTVYPKD
jgi:hypothetical protein